MVGGVRAAAARNILKAWVLVLLLAAVFGGIGWLLADVRIASVFVFCSLLAASAAYAVGDRALLGMLGARPFALAEDPLLRSTLDRLAAQVGVQPPKLQLIDDTFPRAFAVGRGPRSATVAVSSGLLTALAPSELEAVLAHEVAHVRSRDVLTQTFAVLFATTLLELVRIGGFLSRFLLAVLAPIAAAFTHLLLSPKRELARTRRGPVRRSTRPRGRADPARPRGGAGRVPRVAGDGASLHREPVRPHRADLPHVRDASPDRRSRRAAAGTTRWPARGPRLPPAPRPENN